MDQLEIFKALSNPARLQIVQWLKEPERHFAVEDVAALKKVGVCVGHIRQKAGLTQSTVSEYLSILQKAGLLQSTRVGQWTYYKRKEETFRALSRSIRKEL